MLHPILRDVLKRASREVVFESSPCGTDDPQRAVDLSPVEVSHDELEGWIRGTAIGMGTALQRGVTERMFSGRVRCTHPGHYEMDP